VQTCLICKDAWKRQVFQAVFVRLDDLKDHFFLLRQHNKAKPTFIYSMLNPGITSDPLPSAS